MKKLICFILFALCGSVLPACGATIPRRATLAGGGGFGGGKCTVEVDVDGKAQVSVSGDMGQLTTLSGQSAVWRRFQCTGPLPRTMADFRFKGVAGRGK